MLPLLPQVHGETSATLLTNAMNGQRNKIVLIVGALVCVAVLGFVLRPREPSYQGKSLSYWLRQWGGGSYLDLTGDSKEALRQMGTNVFPHLMSRLCKKDSKVKVRAVELCEKLGWHIQESLRGAEYNRVVAVTGFGVFGGAASNCVPEIAKLLADAETRWHAALALTAIGQTAIPALTNALF